MIFSEIYSAYYRTVSEIIKKALSENVSSDDIRNITEKYAFSESILSVEPSLRKARWPFLKKDGTTVIRNTPSVPLTGLQKSWLKAISLDPRIKLFEFEINIPEDTEPLFTPDDYYVFDKYSDGDDFDDESYINNFRTVLDAVRNKKKLLIENMSLSGKVSLVTVLPQYIEYSEKDDKFRVATGTGDRPAFINIGRIVSCEPAENSAVLSRVPKKMTGCSLTFELRDERNALERVLLHFSHFEKEAVRTGDDTYSVTLKYDKSDETELVIRVLSFGPLIKITGPDEFTELIKERLRKQRSLTM